MKTFRIRKTFFSLIETLIAFSLTMILITTVFGIYQYIEFTHIRLEKMRSENLRIQYVKNRLKNVLTKIVSPNSPGSYFYTKTDESNTSHKVLIFTYDRGVDIHPEFSNHVISTLHIDKENQLALTTWPSPTRWTEEKFPIQKEILLENVLQLDFSFYAPPVKDNKTTTTFAKPSESNDSSSSQPYWGEWQDEWYKEYEDIPALIKVKITREAEKNNPTNEIFLIFSIPNTLKHIKYFD